MSPLRLFSLIKLPRDKLQGARGRIYTPRQIYILRDLTKFVFAVCPCTLHWPQHLNQQMQISRPCTLQQSDHFNCRQTNMSSSFVIDSSDDNDSHKLANKYSSIHHLARNNNCRVVVKRVHSNSVTTIIAKMADLNLQRPKISFFC